MSEANEGFTRRIVAENSLYILDLLIRPGANLDGTFMAWDIDEEKFIKVNGWVFAIEDVE